jgi:hypothetical protein
MGLFQEGYKLCYRQMVAQLYISKEMCSHYFTVHYYYNLLIDQHMHNYHKIH